MQLESNSIELVPYCYVDGVPTLTDSEFMWLMEKAASEEPTNNFMFYGDTETTAKDFLYNVKSSTTNEFFMLCVDNNPVGYIYLDCIAYDHAQFHFWFFKEIHKHSKELMDEVVKRLITKYAVLFGIIPKDNRVTTRFAHRMCWKLIGTIPKYFYNSVSHQYVDGVMYVTARR